MQNKWIIEGYFGKNAENLQRIPLNNFPVVIGRDPGLPVSLQKSEVSRNHAKIFSNDGQLTLADLNSTNGTFINHQRISGDTPINHGDVVHFASCEVRFLSESLADSEDENCDRTMFNVAPLSSRLPTGLRDLQTMLDEKAVKACYQPIVSLQGEIYGFEVLGRGGIEGLPVSPMELFRIAESMPGKAAQSEAYRLFVNTHPEEVRNMKYLLGSVESLRKNYPDLPIVLEIHENAISDIQSMKDFAVSLDELGIELAFDDFGAGQSRLMELADVPVHYVKFDIALIRNLHNAPESKRKMVKALAAMTQAMGVKTLAEGVEEEAELALCREMQFDLIQGYMFGKPSPELKYPQG